MRNQTINQTNKYLYDLSTLNQRTNVNLSLYLIYIFLIWYFLLLIRYQNSYINIKACNINNWDKIIKCWNNKIWWLNVRIKHKISQHQSLIESNTNQRDLKIWSCNCVWIRKNLMANILILLFRSKTNHRFRIFNRFLRNLIEIRFS